MFIMLSLLLSNCEKGFLIRLSMFQGLKLCASSYQLCGLGSLPNRSVPQFSHLESGVDNNISLL